MRKRAYAPSYNNFIRNTLQLLKAKSWEQRELAMRAHIPRSNLSNFLTGKTQPSLNSVDKIAKAFGISAGKLIAGPTDQDWSPITQNIGPDHALEILKQYVSSKGQS